MIYGLLHIVADFVLRFLFFLRVYGSQNYKSISGGFILISNHKSYWDPSILGDAIRGRYIVYMAKEELFQRPLARFFLRQLHAVPLSRGHADLTAFKTALNVLKSGRILGVFPEGTRHRDGRIGEFEHGAALLSLRADVPVVPAYIKGGYRLFRPVSVYFGEPIHLRDIFDGRVNGNVVREATQLLRSRMVALQQQFQ